MTDETIKMVERIVKADPEATPEAVRAVVNACMCTTKRMTRKPIGTRAVCELLGVSRMTVHNWGASGRLTPIRLSNRIVRFDPDQVERLAGITQ